MATENLIFRFKFSSDFTDRLTPFAKLHQYDDRHTYKEAWTQWLVINDELVDMEVRRLKGLGYDGNIVDKMYKSGRYYFRNKSTNANTEAKPRRVYVSLEHDVIDAMDIHISVNYYLPCFKPSIAYDQFCMEHTKLINDEITRLLQEDLTKEEERVRTAKAVEQARIDTLKADVATMRHEKKHITEINDYITSENQKTLLFEKTYKPIEYFVRDARKYQADGSFPALASACSTVGGVFLF